MTKPNPENCKNCSSKCAYDCAQLQYTIQHRTVLIIFPGNLIIFSKDHSSDVVYQRRGTEANLDWYGESLLSHPFPPPLSLPPFLFPLLPFLSLHSVSSLSSSLLVPSLPSFPFPFSVPFPYLSSRSPLFQLGSLEECCKLPSGFWGKAPAEIVYFVHFSNKMFMKHDAEMTGCVTYHSMHTARCLLSTTATIHCAAISTTAEHLFCDADNSNKHIVSASTRTFRCRLHGTVEMT